MTATECRDLVTEARAHLDRAMRALSVPRTDWHAVWSAADGATGAMRMLARAAQAETWGGDHEE